MFRLNEFGLNFGKVLHKFECPFWTCNVIENYTKTKLKGLFYSTKNTYNFFFISYLLELV